MVGGSGGWAGDPERLALDWLPGGPFLSPCPCCRSTPQITQAITSHPAPQPPWAPHRAWQVCAACWGREAVAVSAAPGVGGGKQDRPPPSAPGSFPGGGGIQASALRSQHRQRPGSRARQSMWCELERRWDPAGAWGIQEPEQPAPGSCLSSRTCTLGFIHLIDVEVQLGVRED